MSDLINGFTIEEVRKMDLFTYLSDVELLELWYEHTSIDDDSAV